MNIDKLLELLNAEADHWHDSANTLAIDEHRKGTMDNAKIGAFYGREEGFILAIQIVKQLAEEEKATTEDRTARMEAAIRKALADSESGKGWGPDVTVCEMLRKALG